MHKRGMRDHPLWIHCGKRYVPRCIPLAQQSHIASSDLFGEQAQLPAIPSPAIVAGLAPGAVQQTFNFIAFLVFGVHVARTIGVGSPRETAS